MSRRNHRNQQPAFGEARADEIPPPARGFGPAWGAVCVVGLTLLVKAWLAASWGPLADEAYYAVWGRQAALGYYDQPPLIAWLTPWSSHPLVLRAAALLAGLVGTAALVGVSRDRPVAALWWAGVPALAWLTLFQTPDALLLGAWAVVLAAATAGGRWWLLAGLAWAVAILSKHTGVVALPLALVALGPREWRSPWPWLAMAVGLLLVVPHVAWLGAHDWVTLRFQAAQGLVVGRPGWAGPPRVALEQLLVLGPVTAIVALVALPGLWARRASRAVRVGAATTVAVAGAFLLASPLGAPEAHWPAPAWLGLGLAMSAGLGRPVRRWVLGGLGVGAAASLALATHATWPWLPLSPDPGERLREGAALSAFVAELDGPIVTERYQEAALIHLMTGRAAVRAAGCGREDQYTLWPAQLPDEMWMIRPRTSGPALCTDPTHPRRLETRQSPTWQAFRVAR